MAVEIAGYRELTEIGRGGFAVVYRAEQQGFGRTVAVKVLARLNVDERTRRRFSRECEVMGGLSWHPHIVVVYDNGLTEEGQPFIAMEYMAAGSLADRCRELGRIPEQDVLRWGVQVAGALQTAHDAGVHHRDIKPENVLLDVFGQAKLTDFGIARLAGVQETTAGSAAFTVIHAAPEVLNGQATTDRSDLYSLGSTLFHLLSGTAAFRRETDESVTATLLRVIQAPVPDLRAIGVGDDLASLIEALMAKDPEARPESASEVGEALQAIQAARGWPVSELRLHPDRSRDPVSPPSPAERQFHTGEGAVPSTAPPPPWGSVTGDEAETVIVRVPDGADGAPAATEPRAGAPSGDFSDSGPTTTTDPAVAIPPPEPDTSDEPVADLPAGAQPPEPDTGDHARAVDAEGAGDQPLVGALVDAPDPAEDAAPTPSPTGPRDLDRPATPGSGDGNDHGDGAGSPATRRRLAAIVGVVVVVILVGVGLVVTLGGDGGGGNDDGVAATATTEATSETTSQTTSVTSAAPAGGAGGTATSAVEDDTAAFCNSLALISASDRRSAEAVAGITAWAELQPLVIEGSNQAADLYAQAAELAPNGLVDELELMAAVTSDLAAVAGQSTSAEDFQADGQQVDNFAQAQVAIDTLDAFSRETCGVPLADA